jgi:hypothetical protein
MKRLFRRALKAIWMRTHPIRHPLMRKLEDLIARSTPRTPPCRVSDETGLLMDLMVRELVRLQKQVDAIQQAVEDLAPGKPGLAVVRENAEAG